MRWICALLAICIATSAQAHDSRPVSLSLTEASAGQYKAQIVVPGSVAFDNLPQPVFPASCQMIGGGTYRERPAKREAEWVIACQGPLAGTSLGLTYPSHNPSLTAVLRVQTLSGLQLTKVLGPEETSWTLPSTETASGAASQYFLLGLEHIAGGYDHLLFLLCMLMIARRPARIVLAITGFTLAHSITLALSTLGLVGAPISVIEVLIAMSIVFVAAEIARGNKSSLTFQYPILVTSCFGLLHGFGFASALSEIGLPQSQLPLALLMFNVGIEAGQLLIVAVVLGGLAALSRLPLRLPQQAPTAFIYGVGAVSAFWFVERLAGTLAA